MTQNKISTQFRLLMVKEPKEETINYTDKNGKPRSMERESLEGYLLGTDSPMSVVDVNLNKYVNNSQVKNVKITDLLKTFVKNEDDLKVGKKVLLANVELLPVKNAASEQGIINRFEPFLTSYDIADATTEDSAEIGSILRVIGE